MKKFLFLTAIAVGLSACADPPDVVNRRAKAEFGDKLPKGCEIKYLGSLYTGAYNIPVIVTTCEGHRATTSSYNMPSGKTKVPVFSVLISG